MSYFLFNEQCQWRFPRKQYHTMDDATDTAVRMLKDLDDVADIRVLKSLCQVSLRSVNDSDLCSDEYILDENEGWCFMLTHNGVTVASGSGMSSRASAKKWSMEAREAYKNRASKLRFSTLPTFSDDAELWLLAPDTNVHRITRENMDQAIRNVMKACPKFQHGGLHICVTSRRISKPLRVFTKQEGDLWSTQVYRAKREKIFTTAALFATEQAAQMVGEHISQFLRSEGYA